MNQYQKIRNAAVLVLFAGVMSVATGCDNDGKKDKCRLSADCEAGQFCISGSCVTDTMYEPDSASDTQNGSVGTDTPTETATDTDSLTSTDSDSVVLPTACTANDQCDDSDPCTVEFCNTSQQPYICEYQAAADGMSCDDGDPCTGTNVCRSGQCVNENVPCTGPSQASNGCVDYDAACDPDVVGLCVYSEKAAEDGTPCLNADPCHPGVCAGGVCEAAFNACANDDNPCTAFTCEPTGDGIDDYSCVPANAPNFNTCQVESAVDACFKTDSNPDFAIGYCYAASDAVASQCIIGMDRVCFDATLPNMCTAEVCVSETGGCVDVAAADVATVVDCDQTVTVTAAQFMTTEYYSYSEACEAANLRGPEAAVRLDISAPVSVTFTVTETGDRDIQLMYLTDLCDPGTCQMKGFSELTVPAMTSSDVIVIEAGAGPPPDSIEIAISCQ